MVVCEIMIILTYHLPLFFSINQIVLVLHADKLGPPILLCYKLHSGKLSRPHAAGTDVPDLTTLHQIMQSLHGLLDGDTVVESVDLQKINVVGTQSLQGSIDLLENS